MAAYTLIPQDNESPDATLGGNAMDTPTDTGHAASSAITANGNSEAASCRWFNFPTVSGQVTALTLKVTHTSSGTLTGAGAANSFDLEYSLNGGGSWISIVSRSDFTAEQGPTVASIVLSASQTISQIQLRDFLSAATLDVGESATASATIASIQLEVAAEESHGGGMM